MRFIFLLSIILSPITLVLAGPVEFPFAGASFLDARCLDCHDEVEQKGDLNLETLTFDPTNSANHYQWVRLFDKVSKGEMPPKKEKQPTPEEREAFLAELARPLIEVDQARQAQFGRGVARRLNRVEFETALTDLFQIPLRIQAQLPADGKGSGFSTVGAALNVSSVQMESYLDALDFVLDQATTLHEKPERRTWRLSYKDTTGMMMAYRRTNAFSLQEDGVAFLGQEFHSYLNSVLDHFTIPYSGKYRVKVSAYAIHSEEPVLFTIRTGGPGHSEMEGVPRTLLGHVDVNPGSPQVFEFESRLDRGQFFRMYPSVLPVIRFDHPRLWNTQKDWNGPGVVVQWIEVDGPILDKWPPASHQRLWAGVKTEPLLNAKPNIDPNEQLNHPPTDIAKPRMKRLDEPDPVSGNRMVYDPSLGIGGEPIYKRAKTPDPLHATFHLVPDNPKADAARLLRDFVQAAYRRPTTQEEIQRFVHLAQRWLDEGDDFETAMRAAYKAVLVSPGFLYHPGTLPLADGQSTKLDNYALANRLAFFLWNGLPDAELLRYTKSGNLSDPDTLHAQTERMLSDSKSERFLKDFLDQWLDLRLLDFTTPDSALFPENDQVLRWSLEAETRAFFQELLVNDLSVQNIIDSDFAMLNSRLGEHYDIPGLKGTDIRKVPLSFDSPRGGLLTQASILKVTANGSNTSPVVRGVWISDRIMGQPSDPPPPSVPAVEPDIRGAVTIRQQLEKHRELQNCARCHVKVDPPGVALESFDVIGAWRDHYRVLDPEKANLQVIGRAGMTVPIKYNLGLPVDASSQLADGRSFNDIHDFKKLLLEDTDQIARTVAARLVIYSTGAPISFADRIEIENIVAATRTQGHGFRSLIHEVIQNPLFQSK